MHGDGVRLVANDAGRPQLCHLVQVTINDLVMVVAFAPIVAFLLG